LLLDQGRERNQLQIKGEIELDSGLAHVVRLRVRVRMSSWRLGPYRGDEKSEGNGLLSARHGDGYVYGRVRLGLSAVPNRQIGDTAKERQS
jgi:hypothetical protein